MAMPEYVAEWLYAPTEKLTPEEEIRTHQEILSEIQRALRWTKDPRKVADLQSEAIWRREEIRRLMEEQKKEASKEPGFPMTKAQA